MGWQPIHRAVAHRWPVDRLKALLRGGADPRLPSAFGETPLQICTLADAARGALPEDKALTKVLREALRPWHPERHGLFPRSFAPRVIAVLLVQQRLERLAAEHERAASSQCLTRLQRLLGVRFASIDLAIRAPARTSSYHIWHALLSARARLRLATWRHYFHF